jgi:hypothetical protein
MFDEMHGSISLFNYKFLREKYNDEIIGTNGTFILRLLAPSKNAFLAWMVKSTTF